MSKAVLIICLVALGISTISLVVSTIRLAYWDVKRREEYKEIDGVITIKKNRANDVGEIKHIVVCSPTYTRYFYSDSMPTQCKGGDEE